MGMISDCFCSIQDPTLHPEYVSQVPIQKTCSKCKETKSASEFFKDKSKPDGMYSQVRTCSRGSLSLCCKLLTKQVPWLALSIFALCLQGLVGSAQWIW